MKKKTLEDKLQWVRTCVDSYLNEKTINDINPYYYKDWMLNVRDKVLRKIDEREEK